MLFKRMFGYLYHVPKLKKKKIKLKVMYRYLYCYTCRQTAEKHI